MHNQVQVPQQGLPPRGGVSSKSDRLSASQLNKKVQWANSKLVASASSPNLTWEVTDLAQFIDQRLEDIGGHNMANEIEQPRFQLLKDACLKKDLFYLHFHSLYCTWSISPDRLPPMPGHDMNAIRQGFRMLESVLKKNDQFSPQNLVWCASFPHPTFNTSRPTAVAMVARFLTSLTQNWPALDHKIAMRQYPYLVDELLGTLHCSSMIMQNILFTACRRRLGLSDGYDLGIQTQRYFEQDQKRHLDEKGEFRSVNLSDELIERWNQDLINGYRQLVGKHEERQHVICQSRQSQQQSQQQQSYGQNGPSSTANHIASQVIHNNTYYAANQAAMTAASQPRASFSPNSPVVQSPDQTLPWPQQTSSSHSVAGIPIAAHTSLPPQTSGYSFHSVPSSFVLQSSAAMPNLSDAAAMQMAANQQPQSQILSSPHQYQANMTPQGQALQRQWLMQQQQQQQQQEVLQRQQQLQLQQRQQQQQYMLQGYLQPQWSQALNQPFVPYSYGPQMYSPGQAQTFIAPSNPQAGGHQPNYQVQQVRGAMTQQQGNQQAAPMALNNANRGVSHPTSLVPRTGQVIDRSQYPHSHQEKKSLLMAIHQVHARSPERTRPFGDADERYYQSVHSFAVAPFRLAYLHQLDIAVSSEQYSQLCRKKELPDLGGNPVTTTVREYTNGSLRLRARCCRLLSEKSVAESEWVTKESMWPEHIYIRFNDKSITIRRSTHNGKDLPVELTDFVLPGVNKLQVATSSKGPTSADRRDNLFYMAIEVVESASHSDIMERVQSNGRIDRKVTLDKIRSRVDCVPDEDGIAIIDRTGDTTQELSIDLTDPFSAKIFEVPARGVSCTHMECFDLETWLATRPTKQQIKCGHKEICTCPKRMEPSEPDKWKCPICFGDARPGSLRVDTFLEDVRKKLQSENKLDTKSILVAADGTWRPVVEPAGDDDDSDVEGPASRKTCATLRDGPSKSASIERAPVEIIELD